MTNATLELLDLERQYWQAIKDKDAEAATRLTDDECIVTGAQGVGCINRKVLADMMTNAPYTLHAFELKMLRSGRCVTTWLYLPTKSMRNCRRWEVGDAQCGRCLHVGAARWPLALRASHGIDRRQSLRP
jgi:hypothetical protein